MVLGSKVPVAVIRKKYEGQCHQKTISYLIDTYTQKIINEKLDLVDTPSAKLLDASLRTKIYHSRSVLILCLQLT